MRPASTLVLVLLVLAAPLLALVPAAAAANDGGSGADAGNSFAAATPVAPVGRYSGQLVPGDEDWFRFPVAQGSSIDIDVDIGLVTGFLQAGDADRRMGVRLYDPHGLLLDTPVSNVGDARVTWPSAHVAGEYRLALVAQLTGARPYSFCFVVTGETCATHGMRPIDLGVPLTYTHAEVLLVPPTAFNPGGSETPVNYLEASLAGIHAWEPAIDQFAAKYPQYAYLRQLTTRVEVFDGTPQRAGYDVIIIWAPYTGPVFRGLASNPWGGGVLQTSFCLLGNGVLCQLRGTLEPVVHDGTRIIVMSSFAAAPRGGQVMPDFPERNDVYNVMLHEFAHTYGLGHTQTWTAAHGPDLMNSPYALTFGDGDPLGDGGERTPAECISSLDLYGMARLYEWVGRGVRWEQRQGGTSASLPGGMSYELFCV